MSAILFDGKAFADEREAQLRKIISRIGMPIRMTSVVFQEDQASQLYTRLKFEAASRVGIEFDRVDVSITDSVQDLQKQIAQHSAREDIQGLMIQKPSKVTWTSGLGHPHLATFHSFSEWWTEIVSAIDPKKDVDCLTRVNLQKVFEKRWHILPATVKAIISILIQHFIAQGEMSSSDPKNLKAAFHDKKVVIINRSDIVGRPLAAVIQQWGGQTELCGSRTLDLEEKTQQADILVTATGKKNFITGNFVKPEAMVIDVGAPSQDVEFDSVKEVASFLTPVPNGVGPITVVSLLENLISLISSPDVI